MELRHLRYFVGVAEELHFGRAAARLGISQPPLSQQIRLLEDELGVSLFERTSRRVQLTEPGRLFLEEARRTLAQADHAVEIARRAEAGETGSLSIAFTTSVPFAPIIASALFAFRESHPTVHLDLAEMLRPEQVSAVMDRRIDIGFIRDAEAPAIPEPLVSLQVLEEPLVIAMRSDHPLAASRAPVALRDLAGVPMILYSRHLGIGFNDRLTELFQEAGLTPNITQEVNGVASLLGLVTAGFGITVLSRSLTALRPDNIVYRQFDEPRAITGLWLIHRAELSPSGRQFVALLQREIAAA